MQYAQRDKYQQRKVGKKYKKNSMAWRDKYASVLFTFILAIRCAVIVENFAFRLKNHQKSSDNQIWNAHIERGFILELHLC